MSAEEVIEALKSLTIEEKEWMNANQEHPRTRELNLRASMASTEAARDYDDKILVRTVKDFKKWFANANKEGE